MDVPAVDCVLRLVRTVPRRPCTTLLRITHVNTHTLTTMNTTQKQASTTQNGRQTRTVNPWGWQDQYGYSQALETTAAERVLYCAGQTSMNDDGQPLHPGDMGAQVRQAMENLETVLKTAGYSLADVVRLQVYTTDVEALFANYGEFVGPLADAGIRPPTTLLGVNRLAFPELMVEIEATAAKAAGAN